MASSSRNDGSGQKDKSSWKKMFSKGKKAQHLVPGLPTTPSTSSSSLQEIPSLDTVPVTETHEETRTVFMDKLYPVGDDDADIDIVAVHGLNPLNNKNHALGTWTAANGKVWLRDFLPLHAPKSRILLFGYNSNVAFNTSSADLEAQADQLLRSLRHKRRKTADERPILFICHSLGGLLVKQALISAKLDEKYTSILRSTYGIMFFATPHKGGHCADLGSTAAWWARIISGNVDNDMMQVLKKGDAYPEMLKHNYRHQLGDYKIFSFYESHGMKGRMVVVDKDSATFGLSTKVEEMICIPGSDHSTVCKFESQDSEGYQMVQPEIDELINDVLEKVKIRDERIKAGDQQVKEQLLCTITMTKEISKISETLQGAREDAERKRQQEEDVRRAKNRTSLLEWLSDIDPSSNFNTAIGTRKKVANNHTGDWLLENADFKRWQRESKSLLWLNGKAGSGKSVLCATAVRHLRSLYGSSPETAIAQFYFSFSDGKKQNVVGMLSSITKQLCCCLGDLPPAVDSLLQYKEKNERPDIESLEDALLAALHRFTDVYLIIDAIDECPANNSERHELLTSLLRLRTQAPPSLHLLLTSRREFDIEAELHMPGHLPILDVNLSTTIRSSVNRDIVEYIDQVFKEQPFCAWAEDIREEAKSTLIKKADGMFQYVACQFSALKPHRGLAKIRQALQDLPNGLDETYERILDSVEPAYRKQVASTLKWLTYSYSPLSLEEISEVFILDPEEDPPFNDEDRLHPIEAVLGYLSGFVVMVRKTVLEINHPRKGEEITDIRFAHFSIQEYLSSERASKKQPFFSTRDQTLSHLHIGESCLAYNLQLSSPKEPQISKLATKDTLKQYHLWYYARSEGLKHLDEVSYTLWTASICSKVQSTFVARSQAYCNLWKILSAENDIEMTPLFFAVASSLLELSKFLIEEGADINGHFSPEANIRVDLLAVAIMGANKVKKTDFVKLLLANGSNANEIAVSRDGNNYPLTTAASEGALEVVTLLLDHGADLNAIEDYAGTALHAAAHYGHLDIVQLLLDHGANVILQGGKYGTALQAAAYYGHLDIVQLILDHSADVNLQGRKYVTLLQAAIVRSRHLMFSLRRDTEGDQGIIQLLLSHNADPKLQGGLHGTALQAAAYVGDLKIVQLLLQPNLGLDVNMKGGLHGNALQAAVARDTAKSLEVANLLLSRGALVDPPGEEWDALLARVMEEYGGDGPPREESVKRLRELQMLQKDPGVYVDMRLEKHKTAIRERDQKEKRREEEAKRREAARERRRMKKSKQAHGTAGYYRCILIVCNNCLAQVSYTYHRCKICGGGIFDLCQSCVDNGITCHDDNHHMAKHIIQTRENEQLESEGYDEDEEEEDGEDERDVFKKLEEERQEEWTRLSEVVRRKGKSHVFCDRCTARLIDPYYHCKICNIGDFDLCQHCVDEKVSCEGEEHRLIKRVLQNGEIFEEDEMGVLRIVED